MVTVATLAATILLYIYRAEGLLPGAGHGRDPGRFRRLGRRFRSPRWRSGSRRWPRWFSQDPDVQSLSSFIGIDGVNPTMNSGRIQINLKPLEERAARAPEIIRRLQPKVAAVQGITLLHAAGAGPDDRKPRGAHAVSIQPGGRRRERTERSGRRG